MREGVKGCTWVSGGRGGRVRSGEGGAVYRGRREKTIKAFWKKKREILVGWREQAPVPRLLERDGVAGCARCV